MLKFSCIVFAYILIPNKSFHNLLLSQDPSYHQYHPSMDHQPLKNLFHFLHNLWESLLFQVTCYYFKEITITNLNKFLIALNKSLPSIKP